MKEMITFNEINFSAVFMGFALMILILVCFIPFINLGMNKWYLMTIVGAISGILGLCLNVYSLNVMIDIRDFGNFSMT